MHITIRPRQIRDGVAKGKFGFAEVLRNARR